MSSPHTISLKHPVEKKIISIDFLAIRKALLLYRALNNNMRKRILRLLDTHNKMTVSELTGELRIEQPIVSQHLGILRKAHFVTSTRSGKYIWYSINYEQVEHATQITAALLKQ